MAKQTERTKLLKVTLPGCYQALGKHLYEAGSYRGELAGSYQTIAGLVHQITQIKTQAAAQPKAEGVAAKAKASAKTTEKAIQVKALKMKVAHALAEMGQAAFEKKGAQCGPDEFMKPIVNARSRMETLDSEISELSTSPPGQILTPMRIVIGGVVVIVVLVPLIGMSLLVASGIVGWGSPSNAEITSAVRTYCEAEGIKPSLIKVPAGKEAANEWSEQSDTTLTDVRVVKRGEKYQGEKCQDFYIFASTGCRILMRVRVHVEGTTRVRCCSIGQKFRDNEKSDCSFEGDMDFIMGYRPPDKGSLEPQQGEWLVVDDERVSSLSLLKDIHL